MALPPANPGFGGHATTRCRRFRAPGRAFHARRPIAEHVDRLACTATRFAGTATRLAGLVSRLAGLVSRLAGLVSRLAGTATRVHGTVSRRLRAAIAPI
jgi:hypothetical protein